MLPTLYTFPKLRNGGGRLPSAYHGVLRRLELGFDIPSSQSMSRRIGFSGDPSPDDAVVLVCSFLVSLPSPFSVIDHSKVGGGDRMGGSSSRAQTAQMAHPPPKFVRSR
jgi:hypothetical protein